jgi:cobalt/nickel transport system ATP-binding protein
MLPDVGRVRVFDTDIDKRNVASIRKVVGLVFQDADSQLFSPTVMDDVMFGPLNLGMSVEEARKKAQWALDIVGIKDVNKVPHYMSGGQKRLVAIAGVLAMQPKILVVDEPTGDLDPSNAHKIENLLRSLRDEHGMSVVIALHDMDLAARLADRICIVKEGSIVAEGRPEDVLYDEKLLESAGLELPAVASLYKDLGLDKRGKKRPLSLDELRTLLAE